MLFPEFLAPPQPDGASDEWYTPRWLLDWVPPVGFDPCWAPESNVRPAVGWDVRSGHNGLLEPWPEDVPGIVFVNPPYSDCASWVAKCQREADRLQRVVVALVPGYAGDQYWHRHVWGRACWVGFIAGRIRFDTLGGQRAKDAASFTSALVCWGPADAAGTVLRTVRERAAGQRGLWTVNAMTPHTAEPDDCSCDDRNGIDADAGPEETVSEPLPPHVARIGRA